MLEWLQVWGHELIMAPPPSSGAVVMLALHILQGKLKVDLLCSTSHLFLDRTPSPWLLHDEPVYLASFMSAPCSRL